MSGTISKGRFKTGFGFCFSLHKLWQHVFTLDIILLLGLQKLQALNSGDSSARAIRGMNFGTDYG